MKTVIRTTGLCKAYRGRPAVDHLDMQVEQGAVYGFIGQNGAGKSTTFKMLCGLARPAAGQIELFGQPHTSELARRRVGILIEDAGVYPGLSAFENCKLKAMALGLADGDRQIRAILDQVGLQGAGNKKVKAFSMGMRRRLGLALALLGSPDLLLLDEPTNGLDPEGIRDIRSLLVRYQQERGVTVVISSHILGELEKIATAYGIIRQGRMVEQVSAADLAARCRDFIRLQTADPRRAAVVLEQRGLTRYEVLPQGEIRLFDEADPAAVNAALAQSGVPVGEIAVHRQALEDYFLQRMGKEGEQHA